MRMTNYRSPAIDKKKNEKGLTSEPFGQKLYKTRRMAIVFYGPSQTVNMKNITMHALIV